MTGGTPISGNLHVCVDICQSDNQEIQDRYTYNQERCHNALRPRRPTPWYPQVLMLGTWNGPIAPPRMWGGGPWWYPPPPTLVQVLTKSLHPSANPIIQIVDPIIWMLFTIIHSKFQTSWAVLGHFAQPYEYFIAVRSLKFCGKNTGSLGSVFHRGQHSSLNFVSKPWSKHRRMIGSVQCVLLLCTAVPQLIHLLLGKPVQKVCV